MSSKQKTEFKGQINKKIKNSFIKHPTSGIADVERLTQ